MNGSHSIIALAVAAFVVIFVGKLILRRVGRPVTKVYNTVTPAVYMPPPTYIPPQPPVYPVGGYPPAQMPVPVSQEIPVPAEPMTEDELFDDIVRNYHKP